MSRRPPVQPPPAPGRPARPRRGMSMLELQVALVILASGLVALGGLLATHSRQVRQAENWCVGQNAYYLAPHANKWMRLLGPPASPELSPPTAWQPDVTLPADPSLGYRVQVLSHDLDAQRQVRTARLQHTPVNGS